MEVIAYGFVTIGMYILASSTKSYTTYTGWSRAQMIMLSLFQTDVSKELMVYNAYGCFFAVHCFYALTKYEVLHTLASRSLSPYSWYQICPHKKLLHFIGDFVLHGTPILIVKNYSITVHPYYWLVAAIPHCGYCYCLTKSWNPAPLYGVKNYPYYMVGWEHWLDII